MRRFPEEIRRVRAGTEGVVAENAARTGRLVRSFCDARLPEPGKARVQAAPWPPPAPVAIPAHDTPGGAALPALEPHIESLVAALFTVLAAVAIRKASVKAPRDVRPQCPKPAA
jgi:hypothetical protein